MTHPTNRPYGHRVVRVVVLGRTEGVPMGMRRRARRRGLVGGAVAGGAIAHHRSRRNAQPEQAYDDALADDSQNQAQYAPPPVDPADEIEHLAQLHSSGVLTDEEFATAKAKALAS